MGLGCGERTHGFQPIPAAGIEDKYGVWWGMNSPWRYWRLINGDCLQRIVHVTASAYVCGGMQSEPGSAIVFPNALMQGALEGGFGWHKSNPESCLSINAAAASHCHTTTHSLRSEPR